MFSNLNSPHKNTVLRNWVCSIKTCVFRSETNWYTRNTDAHRTIAWKYVFHCTYSIKIKILPMLGTGYFLKIQEILVVTSAYAVRPYSLWRGEGKVITCQLRRGWTMLYFFGGKSCDAFVQPRFSCQEIAQEMEWPFLSSSKTCLLYKLLFKYFIA